jgi:hypothetical protein|eukprot:COSAG02_NODE_440_length_22296_cov_173.657386_4_plen_282_part_00
MDEEARRAFRQNGYFVLKNALTTQHVAELNAAYDAMLVAGAMSAADGKAIRSSAPASLKKAGRGAPTVPVTDRHGRQYDGRRFWNQAYIDLIDHPSILPILEELLGDPEWGHVPPAVPVELRSRIRLDHDNIHYQPAYTTIPLDSATAAAKRAGSNLHGGPAAHHITVVIELNSVGPGDGGFGCLPGSHLEEHNARVEQLPDGWRQNWVDTPWSALLSDWPIDEVPVHRVEAEAGDAIIFTEKASDHTFSCRLQRVLLLVFASAHFTVPLTDETWDNPLVW